MVQHSSIDHTGVLGVPSTLSFGSNSNSVAIANAPGASPSNSRADHVHLGVTSVAHTSNTFSGPVILQAGANIGITSPAAGTLTFSGAAAGGGGAASSDGTLLGLTAYGTSGSYTTTTSVADMDATNLAVVFAAPTSGNVLIRLTCQALNNATTGNLFWGLREGTTVVAGMHQVASPEGEGAGNVKTISRTFYVTGLTPSTSYTYKWAAYHNINSWLIRWNSADASFGFATMEVIAAP